MTPFLLRPFRQDDLASLVKYANDPGVAANLTDAFPHPYTEQHGRQFIERFNAHDPPLVLAIEVNGEAAGAVGLHPLQDVFRRNCEMGYWLARPYWGKGIMSRAVRQAALRAFDILPEVHRVYARPYGSNLASQRVLEKAGFTLEARLKDTLIKHGQVLDEVIYALRRP